MKIRKFFVYSLYTVFLFSVFACIQKQSLSTSLLNSTGGSTAASTGSPNPAGGNQPPPLETAPLPASQVGYTQNTFKTNQFSSTNVDITMTNKSGFQWYVWQFFGSKSKTSAIAFNSDGSLLLNGDTTGPNGEIASIVPVSGAPYFKGTAYGGGAYFEASFKFNPADVIAQKFNGWPSWWSMAAEHLANMPGIQWPGQPSSYAHYIEPDFFEYDLSGYVVDKGEQNYYGGAIRDWYGVYNSTCSGFCNVTTSYGVLTREVPVGTDFTQYHRFGFLWLPATVTAQGYAKYFFDDVQVGQTVSWDMYTGQAPPPTSPWVFSVMDVDHLVLILGTGAGEPMTIESVNVWQNSPAKNLSY